MQVSHVLQTGSVVFDDERVVANAGVGLVSLLMRQLGIVTAADAAVTGTFRPGRKVATVLAGMALGADSIDDLRVLRVGDTERVLDFAAMSPETIGQWLRSLHLGNVSQLDGLLGRSIERAWAAGGGPGDDATVIDIDSTVCSVYGNKQGAERTYDGQHGYHPLVAVRSETGEVIKARLRKGSASSASKAGSFVSETIHRVRRCGARGDVIVRGDTAFYLSDIVARCRKLDALFSLGARDTRLVRETIAGISERSWTAIPYKQGVAQVAEIHLTAPWSCRLIVRRFRNIEHSTGQGQLFDDWKHSAFITNQTGDLLELDARHRQRARQELAFADLKDGALKHFPSGRFNANHAWLVLASLAHNLLRWIHHLALGQPTLLVARTMRFRLLQLPARITRTARRTTIHMPARWPWQRDFIRAVRILRGLTLQPM